MIDTRCDYCIGTANARLQKSLTAMLAEAGFNSSGAANSVPILLRKLRMVQPWLAVIDTTLPPGNIEQLAAIIENDGLAAAIYVNTGGIRLDHYVQLNWPVEAPVLTAVARALCSEFAHKKRLHGEIEALQRKLQERKLIDKAKGILMSRYSLDEKEAFRFLQKNSMEQRVTMTETAGIIIDDPARFSFLIRR